jgi:hypothetical protein
MGTSHQHGFVKRYGLVRDDRHEAPPVMVPRARPGEQPKGGRGDADVSLKGFGESDRSAFFAVVSTNGSNVLEVKFLDGPDELREVNLRSPP